MNSTLAFDLRARLGQHTQSLPAARAPVAAPQAGPTEVQRVFARLQRQGQVR